MRVEIPDYKTHIDFPNGTPHDVIDRVLREHFGAKQPVAPPEKVEPAPLPEEKVEPEIPDIPIDVIGYSDKGKAIKYKESAKTAIADVDSRIKTYQEILEALQ